MSKENNLKDFLTDLHEGISLKKPNASRNPQDFRSEIESITTVDPTPVWDGSYTTYDVTDEIGPKDVFVLYGTYKLKSLSSVQLRATTIPLTNTLAYFYVDTNNYVDNVREIVISSDNTVSIVAQGAFGEASTYWNGSSWRSLCDSYDQVAADKCLILNFSKPIEVTKEQYELVISMTDCTNFVPYRDGYNEGHDVGYDEGYNVGYSEGTNSITPAEDLDDVLTEQEYLISNLKEVLASKIVSVGGS